MDAIRNYLESMFQNLPNTQEVQKAKYELGQMMEDKYTELRNSGKSENEAVGTIIAEFGNLDELADELGIGGYMKRDAGYNVRKLSFQEVKDAISDNNHYAVRIALGVLLCIISPIFPIWMDGLFQMNDSLARGGDAIGIVLMFVTIAIAVGLFVFSGMQIGKWNFLKEQACAIDFASAEFVHNQRENYRTLYAVLTTVGIMLCVVCFIPAVVVDSLGFAGNFMEAIGGLSLLIIVAIGVYMLVAANIKMSGYQKLLSINGSGTMGGDFVPSQKEQTHYNNKTAEVIISVYWPTITCIYLCWSFLSFDWHITWIIWPISGVIHTLLKNIFGNQ